MKHFPTTQTFLYGAQALVLSGFAMTLHAAPGPLAEEPLFLGSTVQPNILFIVDDSGSMDWEVLKSNGALDAHGSGTNSGNLDFTPNDTAENYEHCVGYNVMAYDPTKTYTPWRGKDKNGNTFTDASLTSAFSDPYNNYTTDISSYFYYEWSDLDGDGEYDVGECPTQTSSVSASSCSTISGCVRADSLSADKQKNYANWYSYYRKREFVAKRALSEIITDSDARVGLATLHNNNSVGTIIKDIDDKKIPVDATAVANKAALLTNLIKINSSGGTPLRRTLEEAGKYYTQGSNPGSSFFGFDPGSDSPIMSAADGGSCQQNYTVMMTDGTWNGSSPSAGNADGDNNSDFDGGAYADSYSNTLADVAMKYYETDLHSGLSNDVKIIEGVDTNPAQHMVTYTVAFGLSGTLDASLDPADAGFPGWPQPTSDALTTIDDVRHAAYNGRGEYLSAANPQDLIDSLAASIAGIAKREGSASAVAFSSTSLQTDTKVFQGKFDSGTWFGDLLAFKVTSTGIGGSAWSGSAGDQLDSRNYSTRDIITFNGNKGIPFEWPTDYTSLSASDISQALVADLLADAPYSLTTTDSTEKSANKDYGQKLVQFLRGDFSNEGSLFRDRKGHRLGDIIYSSPEYIGIPQENYPENIASDSFQTFVDDNRTRQGMVYVGANDGMLHGFNAETGAEVFAYVPSFLASADSEEGLHYLADDEYGYRPYVDGTPTAASVYISSKWRTFLVGGARAGGRGIYVLDVTTPSSLSESNADNIVRFEFTHNDLGYTFSKPVVAKMNNGRWAAIFGNGYNAVTGDGQAKIFIVYLDSDGSEYKVLETKVGSNAANDCLSASSDCNGMGSPAVVDITGDGVADRIFAGDLEGNLWVFDVSDSSSSNWGSAYGSFSGPKALFKSPGEPITSKPSVALHPTRFSSTTDPNLMVYFGTGQYMATGDNTTTTLNAFYGVWDHGSDTFAELTQSELKEQVITERGTYRDLTSYKVAYRFNTDPLFAGTLELGWYEELPATGERSVTSAAVRNGVVFYNTLIPDSSTCSFGGSGYLMAVDAETGGLLENAVFDYDNDGTYDDVGGVWLDGIPAESGFISGRQVTQLSSGKIDFKILQPQGSADVHRTSLSIDPK